MTETPTSSDVPEAAQEQLRAAVDVALSKPSQAQGFLSNIPDLSDVGGVKDKVISIIDTVLDAINTALEYKWIIPDKFEQPLQSLADALNKVRDWVD